MTGVISLLGLFLAILAGAMALPSAIAAASGDTGSAIIFLVSGAITAFVGGGLIFALYGVDSRMRRIEVFILAVLTWIVIPVFGAIPLLLSSTFSTMDGAYFEAVSGFTTTGASVVTSLESLPDAIIAWRAILQWLGGLTTILLILLVIAPAGVGGTPGRPLTMVESGARTARHRVRTAAVLFIPLYAGLTFICFGTLVTIGIPVLDSFCLSLSAISTGGFMPRSGGLEIYESRFLDSILGLFMLIGATSIIWHHLITHSRWQVARQYREGLWLTVTVFVVGLIFAWGFYQGVDGPAGIGIFDAIHKGILTAISVVSTTGFEVREGGFAAISYPILLTLALIGGASYSTSGGIKLFRIGTMFEQAGRELHRLIYPHGIRPTQFGGQAYDIQVMKSVWSAFLAYLILAAGVTVLLGFAGIDFKAALLASISAIANIGPLYQSMIPANEGWLEYAEFHPFAKVLLAVVMVGGRLEILAIFALFNISYWRS